MAIKIDTSRKVLAEVQAPRSPSPASEEVARYTKKMSPPGSPSGKRRIFTPILCAATSPAIIAIQDGREADALRILAESPHFLEQGDELGRTPLIWACYLCLTQDFVSRLLGLGANAYVVDQDGFSPQCIAQGMRCEGILEVLPFDPSLDFVIDHKMLGHFFSLKQTFSWRGEIHSTMEYFDFFPMVKKLEKIFENYQKLNSDHFFSPKCFDAIKFTLRSIENRRLNYSLFYQLQKMGKVYICPTGWEDHRIVVVCVKDYLVICDPINNPAVTIYKVDHKRMSQEILYEMAGMEDLSQRDGKEYFYRILPKKLGWSAQVLSADEKRLFVSLRRFSPEKQTAGVCSFSSQISALYVVTAFQMLSEYPERAPERVIQDVAREIGSMLFYLQAAYLAEFIEKYKGDEDIDRPLMKRLVETVSWRLLHTPIFKSWRFQNPAVPYTTLRPDQLIPWFYSKL